MRINAGKLQVELDQKNVPVAAISMDRGWTFSESLSKKLGASSSVVMSTGTNMVKQRGGEALQKDIGTYYWCSTEIDANYAWLMPFGFDRITQISKDSNLFDARAVRTIIVKKN
jgi:hypothetical protein